MAAKIARQSISAPAGSATGGQFIASIVDDVTRETVKSVAVQLGWQNLKLRDGGGDAALAYIKATAAPSFLLVDISDSKEPIATMEAIAKACGADTKVVAIGLLNDVALYRRLIDMGVSDYLVKPVTGQMLSNAIQKATRSEHHEPIRDKSARLIAMIGARGGVGTTTLAVSSAWTLSQEQRLRVVLLDLDLHFGSLALSLDIEPGRGLREILTNPDRVDSLLIGSAMSSANERLSVLAAEEPLEDALNVGHDGFDALVVELTSSADCVIVDTPRSLNGLCRHILEVADIVGIVTERSLPAMRDTQRLLSLIKGMRSDAKTFVIANRVGGITGEVSHADFERGSGAKIDFSIPFDAKAAIAAAERAKALVDVARTAKTATELRSLAIGLAGSASAPKKSLIKRMLGK